jgi:nucleoside-diphosphate-sugar epimerase
LCDEAGEQGVQQFLHLSTGGVYGASVFTPVREDHPHHPHDAYSLSKEAGESAVVHRLRRYGIPFTIFRPTAVYGPFRYRGAFTTASNADFDAMLRERDPASGVRDFEAVNALAEAAGLVLQADHSMPANNQLLVWRGK